MAMVITELQLPTDKLSKYYQFHSNIYDLTRWTFLFGRNEIVWQIPLSHQGKHRILEVGCGTGKNLIALAKRFPNANIIGIDISVEMLDKARTATEGYNNISLLHTGFPADHLDHFDCILISYAMTMMNPGWEFWVSASVALLKNSGYLAVVDFHQSSFNWFRSHMRNHHVKMEGHILPALRSEFNPKNHQINKAYFGLWSYFTFIGKKKNED